MNTTTLNQGDWIVVRYATDRTQNAIYHGTDGQGRIVVRKWQATSRTFTGPVKVPPSDILEKLDEPVELKRAR